MPLSYKTKSQKKKTSKSEAKKNDAASPVSHKEVENTASLPELKSSNKADYYFTHEIGADAFGKVATSGILLAGSLINKAKAGANDVTKSHINPVFTRVLSLNKHKDKQAVKRMAYDSSLVGGEQPIMILINAEASERPHKLVSEYLDKNPRFKANVFNKDIPVGFYKSYIGDTGKTGASSAQELEPSALAKDKRYFKANEQHWNLGVDVKNNVAGIFIKIQCNNDSYGLAKGREAYKNVYKEDELVAIDNDLRSAIHNARLLTDNIWLVGSGAYIEEVAKKL